MKTEKQFDKPTPIWAIIGVFVTFILFVININNLENLWWLFLLFIIMDISAFGVYFTNLKHYEKMLEDGETVEVMNTTLSAPATIKVVRNSSILGMIIPYNVFLNNQFVSAIKNGKTLEIPTTNSYNVITVFDTQGNSFKGNFVAQLSEGGQAEVHVKAGRFVKR